MKVTPAYSKTHSKGRAEIAHLNNVYAVNALDELPDRLPFSMFQYPMSMCHIQ